MRGGNNRAHRHSRDDGAKSLCAALAASFNRALTPYNCKRRNLPWNPRGDSNVSLLVIGVRNLLHPPHHRGNDPQSLRQANDHCAQPPFGMDWHNVAGRYDVESWQPQPSHSLLRSAVRHASRYERRHARRPKKPEPEAWREPWSRCLGKTSRPRFWDVIEAIGKIGGEPLPLTRSESHKCLSRFRCFHFVICSASC
jgi:hypothetical protein